MEQQPHFFFAIRIPNATKQIMKGHLDKLKIEFPFKRWVHHEDLHITLAFLGFSPQDQLEKATGIVEESIKGITPFPLSIHRLGFFGNVHSPRVLWAGMRESSYLQSLQAEVFQACETSGFKLETRPFRPHITLARKWNGAQPFNNGLLDFWKTLEPEQLEFTAAEVVLYQTHMQKTPKYEAKAVFPLHN